MSFLDKFYLFAAIAGLVATIPVYKGWFHEAKFWNIKRRVEKLNKEKVFLSLLRSSDREFLGWMLHSVMLVITIFTFALVFRTIEIDSDGVKVVTVVHSLLGWLAYFIAVSTLGIYHRLRDFDKTIANIDKKIQEISGIVP